MGGGDRGDKSNIAGILWGWSDLLGSLIAEQRDREDGGGTVPDRDTPAAAVADLTGAVPVRSIYLHCVEHGRIALGASHETAIGQMRPLRRLQAEAEAPGTKWSRRRGGSEPKGTSCPQ